MMHTCGLIRIRRSFGSGAAISVVLFGLASPARGQEMSPEIRKHVMKATGQILMGAKKSGEDKIDGIGWGSGWFINSTGLMVTNSHVVNLAHYAGDPLTAFARARQVGIVQYRVTVNGGTDQEKTYKGFRMYTNESADLAFLQVRDDEGAPLFTPAHLELLPSSAIHEGLRVYAIGYPHGDRMAISKEKHAPVTITAGNIEHIIYAPSGRIKKFRSDAEIAGGNSGGPLVDVRGRLVGINVEGGADVGESSGVSAGQIPADVVVDFVKAALGLNKIDTDLSPFLHLLIDKDDNVFVPGRERLSDRDVISFQDGEETVGQIVDKELVWKSPLGTFKVPVARAGFAFNHRGQATLLLDGGERLTASADDIEFGFRNGGGEISRLNMRNLKSVLFRAPKGKSEFPDVDAIIVRGHGCQIGIADIQGEIRFLDAEQGKLRFPLRHIRQIETKSYKQVVHKIDGSTLVGKFEPHNLSATWVLLKSPVSITFENLKMADVDRLNLSELVDKPVSLKRRLQLEGDRELSKIADLLDGFQHQEAAALLDEIVVPSILKSREKPVQEQILALNAEALLRKGDYESALRGFKKTRKAKMEGVASYSLGRYYVLDIYPTGEFHGMPLSDPARFKTAATEISNRILSDARELMMAHRKAMVTDFADWKRVEQKTDRMEKHLQVATSLILRPAERMMFQMWRFRQDRNWQTIKMLLEEREKLQTDFQTRRTQNKSVRSVARKLDKVNRRIQTTLIAYRALRSMMNPLGDGPSYRLDDPDAMEFLN